jgi:hypothetical protein
MRINLETITKIAFHRFFWLGVLIGTLTLLYIFSPEFRVRIPVILTGLVAVGVFFAYCEHLNSREEQRIKGRKTSKRVRAQGSGLTAVLGGLAKILLLMMTFGLSAFLKSATRPKKRKNWWSDW